MTIAGVGGAAIAAESLNTRLVPKFRHPVGYIFLNFPLTLGLEGALMRIVQLSRAMAASLPAQSTRSSCSADL
jgi:hypothetical protein